jgi:hypothetical protein
MTREFLRLSGAFNVAAGVLLLGYWYSFVVLMPYGELSTTLSLLVLDPAWTTVNAVGAAGAILGMLGLPGLYAQHATRLGRSGLVGFMSALLGSALLMGPMLWDTIVWPALARHDPSLLDFDGPIYRSAAFLPFFASAGLVWGLGYAVLAIRIARTGVLPRIAAWLVAVGAPLFGLGALLGKAQAIPRSIGITAFCAGLVWLGLAMRRTAPGSAP